MVDAMEPFQEEIKQPERTQRNRRPKHCAVTLIFTVSVIILIVGIVLIARAARENDSSTHLRDSSDLSCSWFSNNEAKRLKAFLTKTKHAYYQLHPHKVYDDRGFNAGNYKPYNPKPSALKEITDKARALYTELSNLGINRDNLQLRETKALTQLEHYLRHTFGQAYGVNYYAGDWMMAPNMFCWEPICQIRGDIHHFLLHFKVYNLNDLKKLREVLKEQADGIEQYIFNIKQGVRAGMVRSIEECKAGIDAIKDRFLNISLYGEEGALMSSFVSPALQPEFTSKLSDDDQRKWRKEKSLTVKQTISGDIVKYIGKPIANLISFLEVVHIRHCLPSSVSSGLAALPVDYEYLDQIRTNQDTTKTLPTGERLNGSKSYEMIMSFFTTTDVTPEEVNELGHTQLELIYAEAQELSRKVTKLENNHEALKQFRKLQVSPEYRLNQKPFPENESSADAYQKCHDVEGAKKFCPTRWEATKIYWNEARMVMSLLQTKIVSMFHFGGEKITVPVCPVKMTPIFNPSISAEGYSSSDENCSSSAVYYTPFFLESFRPLYEIWSTAAHETFPGHHTQGQGAEELFLDHCDDIVSWMDHQSYYTAFSEGWALYAENPLISETDIYDNDPMQRYGMIKAQIWRALRLIVDTGLHYKGLTRNESLVLFEKYAWDDSDRVVKEVTRYQSIPGQATAYMVGQLHIKKLRDYATEKLGDSFSLQDFHYHLLSQGSAPLQYLTLRIHKYVECTLHVTEKGCNAIEVPRLKKTVTSMNARQRLNHRRTSIFHEMYYF